MTKRWNETTEEEEKEKEGKDPSPVAQDELELSVHAALDAYEKSRDALALAETNALTNAARTGVRVPKRGEIITFYIENDRVEAEGIAAEVLFVHSATVVTLVTTKREGRRNTHSNVLRCMDGVQTGRWDF